MGFTPPGDCPNCGEEVPRGAISCPGCGSCPNTGWSDETTYDGLDLPGESEGKAETSAEGKVWGGLASLALLAFLVWVYVFR